MAAGHSINTAPALLMSHPFKHLKAERSSGFGTSQAGPSVSAQPTVGVSNGQQHLQEDPVYDERAVFQDDPGDDGGSEPFQVGHDYSMTGSYR